MIAWVAVGTWGCGPWALSPRSSGPEVGASAATGPWMTTASGLRYRVERPGIPGEGVKLSDFIAVHYEGVLEDGTVFESSRERLEPQRLRVGQLIEGWVEGMGLMTPGARYHFIIPPDLAYGSAGVPGRVPADATITYDVELFEVESGPPWIEFRRPEPDRSGTTDGGVVYEVLNAGHGDLASPGQLLRIDYAFWDASGALVASSIRDGKRATLRSTAMPYPFLTELLPVLREGGRYLADVPQALLLGEKGGIRGESVWYLVVDSLEDPPPTPEFSALDAADLARTASGITYEILEPGMGASPGMGDRITVHFAGWHTDGELIDSSYPRGVPAQLRFDQAMAGWQEGLAMLKEGGVGRFRLPGELAYGGEKAPKSIGPNRTIIFHLELLNVTGPRGQDG